MKKLFLFAVMLLSIGAVKAQDVTDDFNVGPYEVYYKGKGDVNYRLKKGIDLYEYFGLKRDTVIQAPQVISKPVSHAIQLGVYFSMPRYSKGISNVFGLDASYKRHISNSFMFNAGISLDILTGKYDIQDIKQTLFEAGVPLSIEYGHLKTNKSSLFGAIGIVPTYYATISKDGDNEKPNGFYIAPRADFGGYIPVGSKFIRLDAFIKYNINCSSKDIEPFRDQIGRFFIGMELGLVL